MLYHKPGAISDKIRIIKIDEKTLDRYGEYTDWDRGIYADLVETLNVSEDIRSAVIGFDVIFASEKNAETDNRFAEVCGIYDNDLTADPIIDSSVIYEERDENGDTVYVTTVYITYGYREFNVTYKIAGYGSELDENGYGVYTIETAMYENQYTLTTFPTAEVGDGYWCDEIDGQYTTVSLYVSEDIIFYGVQST